MYILVYYQSCAPHYFSMPLRNAYGGIRVSFSDRSIDIFRIVPPPPDLYERKTGISKCVGPRINGHDAFYTMIIVIRSFDAFHNAVRDLPRWFSCGPWRDGCCRSSTTMTDVRRRRRRAEWNAAEQHWWRITCRRAPRDNIDKLWFLANPDRRAIFVYREVIGRYPIYVYLARAHRKRVKRNKTLK